MTRMRALVVDYGGVLTTSLHDTMSAWCADDGIDPAAFRRVMRDWLGEPYGAEAAVNPVHALERGELDVPDFEHQLADRLAKTTGRAVERDGLLGRMFAGFRREQPMFDVVRRAHDAGKKTALLSNSWGMDYPREEWDEVFDAVVISGEVGMRKPEPEIYLHTAERLAVPPAECVFVDDLPSNVQGALSVGMVGVRFESPEQATGELETLLGLALRQPG